MQLVASSLFDEHVQSLYVNQPKKLSNTCGQKKSEVPFHGNTQVKEEEIVLFTLLALGELVSMLTPVDVSATQ